MSDLLYLIIILLVAAFLLRVDFIFYIVYVCIGIYGWSLWQTPRTVKKLKVKRAFNSHLFTGEQATVAVEVRNPGRLPLPWVQFTETVPPLLRIGPESSRAIALRGRGATRFKYQVRAARRGYYPLGPLFLRSGDLFGFTEEQSRLPADYLTVYPRIIPLEQLGLPSRLPFGILASRQRLFEDPARPRGVREYQTGDSLRQINWKASAHANQLLVKTLQPAISLETTLLLNFNSRDYDRRHHYTTTEWAIEVTASVAAHLIGQRQAVGLITNGHDPLRRPAERPAAIPPQSGQPHLMKLLELLARLEAKEMTTWLEWAPPLCRHLSWGTTILAVTPRGDWETCQMLHQLARAGFNPVLMVVEPDGQFGQVQERARRLGFKAYHVAAKQDLARL